MLLSWTLLACTLETSAVPSVPSQPSSSTVGPPIISVEPGSIQVSGQSVSTTLHPSDERRIPALFSVLPEDGGEVIVEVDRRVSWRPLRRVLLTARERGLGPFWLSVDGNARRGPLTLPTAQPAVPLQEAPRPVGLLRLHQGERVWLDGEVRFRGRRAADCATLYSGEGALRAACMDGQSAAAATSLGCLTKPESLAAAMASWPGMLSGALDTLGAGERWSWVLLVDTNVSVVVLDAVLKALQDTGPERVAIGGASASQGQPSVCTEPVPTASDIAELAARWAGSSE